MGRSRNFENGCKGRDTPDAIRQHGAIFRLSLTDSFDPGLDGWIKLYLTTLGTSTKADFLLGRR
jgi:hypothetical protein